MPTPTKTKKILIGCLVTTVIGGLLVIVVLVFGLRAFVNFGIASDIDEYIDRINHADVSDNNKQNLTHRLEKMQNETRDGRHVIVTTWIESDEKFRHILQDNIITDNEYKKFMNELDYLQREVKQIK